MAVIANKKNQEMKIFADATDLFLFAAEDFCQRAIRAVREKDVFSVVLSGGNTPKSLFVTLTANEYKKRIPWQQIKFFFGDERYVPASSEASNYHLANEYLFAHVPVNPHHIYRIPTEFDDPKDAAKAYEKTLREAFHIKDDAIPPLDLVYLGLGDNAHTASLMPLNEVVRQYVAHSTADNDHQLVAAVVVAGSNMQRITLTPTAINNSRDIIFLVAGANKANAIREVLAGKHDPLHYPAQLIHSIKGKTIWYLDQTAAEKLSSGNS